MPKAKQPIESESESEGSQEEEYEVEAILGHRKTRGNKLEYHVSWKNYGPNHNSWEPEANVIHAEELLKIYWDTQKKAESKEPELAPKKRGRPSKDSVRASSSRLSSSLVAREDNEQPAPKRPRTSAVNGRKRTIKDSSEEPEEEEPAANDPEYVDEYTAYMKMKDWENVVESVDTIDMDDDGKIIVLVTMTKGTKSVIPRDLAYERFPYKVLKFYESHLKFVSCTASRR
ncbi:hypothetical protein L198_07033 [Cryptococcus wingfieldii CBS 7118]|uniref:Chromo domain-containing protein n=1 Tax=Cryptococcus wingfieldii CBS 7118 TaxID=1295528 RepID=A0A1E3IFR0_9TREE|nr:hypothetical protein L198_07033 [Cryptococcus wingfieldii CBS 7118]ODN87409.1 hypothetical protein L198_07033 [Cryptococcus wingfieldii CBS 7118]